MNSIVRTSFVALVLLAATSCTKATPLEPSDGPLQFSGSVSTTAGMPISGAALTVIDGTNKGVQVTTDSSGRFAFASLDGGRFTMTIAAPGFISANPVVELHVNLEVNFALRSAP